MQITSHLSCPQPVVHEMTCIVAHAPTRHALHDASALQGDVASLNGEIQRLLAQLAVASAAAADSTSLLRDADLARSRMEEVCTTLKVCAHKNLPFL